jgi:hypothetical protein
VKPFICTMPMRLDDGWNQVQFNLADFTKRAYGEEAGSYSWVMEGSDCGPACCLEALRRCASSKGQFTAKQLH